MLRKLKALVLKDLFLCFVSAILLILSFPKFDFEFLAWFSFVPIFFALNNKSLKQAFFLFFITGIIFWSGIIYWLVHVTLAGAVVLILYLALYFAIFGLVIRPCTKHSTPYALIFIPSVWVLLEYLRSHLFTGFPWALLGYSQYINLPVIQITDITGAWGVSFLVMMVNVAIVEIIYSGINGLGSKLRTAVISLVLFLSLTLSYGYFKIYSLSSSRQAVSMKISVVQGNISQELKWNRETNDYIINKYLDISRQVVRDKPDLIIWPEAALPVVLEEEPLFFAQVKEFAREAKTALLLGAVTSRNDYYYNSAVLVSREGRLLASYDKLHLVPFGEYIPLRNFLSFLETIVPIGDIEKGKDYAVFQQDGVRFSVLICFEDLFPELSRRFVNKGAEFLVNITNDAWYKKSTAAYQHLQASVFRAVENRVYLARAANTGISGFIAADGKIISLVRDRQGENIFVAGYGSERISITGKSILSFYTKHGDVFVLACFLFILYGIILQFKKRTV
ncbi:MAG: apolipoprotein N-acyltransferase [Candidatus Omnitrophica bacterium]|nr:apolipoprotein N-acyltransferase [Candidatus Omnitrophota bacterium]